MEDGVPHSNGVVRNIRHRDVCMGHGCVGSAGSYQMGLPFDGQIANGADHAGKTRARPRVVPMLDRNDRKLIDGILGLGGHEHGRIRGIERMKEIQGNVARGEALAGAIRKIDNADEAAMRLSSENFTRERIDCIAWKPAIGNAFVGFRGMT